MAQYHELCHVAKTLHVHPCTIRRLTDRGDGPVIIKVGRTHLIRDDHLRRWLQRCITRPPPKQSLSLIGRPRVTAAELVARLMTQMSHRRATPHQHR